MAKPKTVSDEDDSTGVMTFYCPKSKRDKFSEYCKLRGINKSARLRQHMDEDIAELDEGNIKTEFNETVKKAERDVWKKKEDEKFNLLKKTLPMGNSRVPTFKMLCRFATEFGTDEVLSKNLETVLGKLKLYRYKGTEHFDASALFDFIEYVEALMNRRKLEAEIREHWQQTCSPEICVQ